MYKPSKDLQEIAEKIQSFYLAKNNNDAESTNKEIEALKITDIQRIPHYVNKNAISIYTARPGLLIGAKGKTIDALQEFLGMKIFIYESFVWSDAMHVMTDEELNEVLSYE